MAVNETNTAVKSQENTHQNTLTFEGQVIKKLLELQLMKLKGFYQ
ncbi:hypothetical protein [Priestia megaterium]|nr:hypothetical protein [Priestia megaterium]